MWKKGYLMFREEELIHIRGEFINAIKRKNGSVKGRLETLDTLVIHIKKNILEELIKSGTSEIPANINHLVSNQFIKECTIALDKINNENENNEKIS